MSADVLREAADAMCDRARLADVADAVGLLATAEHLRSEAKAIEAHDGRRLCDPQVGEFVSWARRSRSLAIAQTFLSEASR